MIQIPPAWQDELRKLKMRLSDYLEIADQLPSDGRYEEVANHWLLWKKSIPRTFPESIRRILRFLTYRTTPPPSDHQFSLCKHIKQCPRKLPQQVENFECAKFAFGVCVSATLHANKGKVLSIESIGTLSGMSKQGFCRYVHAAQKMMIQRILIDPELADFCKYLGVGQGGTATDDSSDS